MKELFESLKIKEKFVLEYEIKDKEVVIFGAGNQGYFVEGWIRNQGFPVASFLDNNPTKWGTYYKDILIKSPENIKEDMKDNTLILVCSDWSNEINNQLVNQGVTNFLVISSNYLEKYDSEHFQTNFPIDKLNKLYNLLGDEESQEVLINLIKFRSTRDLRFLKKSDYPQYLHPIVRPGKNDVIIDGGAYIGDSAKIFLELLKKECTVYSFEPSKENYIELCQWIKTSKNEKVVLPRNEGLFSESMELYLNTENENSDSFHIDEMGTEKIDVLAIDQFTENDRLKVGLIKMDIEGAELEALKGAVNTIRKDRPKLLICLYHKPTDLYEIPLFLEEQFPEHKYSYYLGHHDNSLYETVLYVG